MKPTPEQVVAEVIAELPEKFEWFYLDQGDRLYEEDIKKILDDGDEGMLSVESEIDERLSDYRYQNESEAIDEAFKDAEHTDHRDLISAEQEDEIREALWDRSESDPTRELLRATPDMYFRYRVDCEVGAEWLMNEEEWEEQLKDIAEAVGIDLDTNRANLREMFANSGDGGGLYVFWRGDVEQMVDAAADFGRSKGQRAISWDSPHLLVLNTMNGSGWECEVSGTITLPFTNDDLYLDAMKIGPGYSWNETTGGLVGYSYDNTPTITEVSTDAEAV